MHELSYTRSILDAVVASAEAAGASRVRSVHLVVGEVRDIVDELFRDCFGYLARNTVAAGAEIFIERVPLSLACRRCGTVFRADALSSQKIACPQCAQSDYAIHSGMEFRIDSIEIS